MIIKNILAKIYIHPLFIICTFIFVVLGKFRFLCYFMLLILIHELGHIVISLLFGWKIDKVIILPFGGLTKYNIKVNTPLIQEFIVSISGIIFQYIFFLILKDVINYKYFDIVNYFIMIFNILPIYPLDGSKILNVFFNIITSFKNSMLLTVIISYIFILLELLYLLSINKMFILVISFLLMEVNKLYKNINSLFNKFVLERYLDNYIFKREKVIDNIYKMKKDYRHLFYVNGKYITEKYYLSKFYKNV